jgi:hypothetical protein
MCGRYTLTIDKSAIEHRSTIHHRKLTHSPDLTRHSILIRANIYDPNFHPTLLKNDLRSFERRTPNSIVKCWRGGVQTLNSSGDNGARAINTRKECRGHVGSHSRGTESRRFKDRQALGMFHPNEATVTHVTLLNIANPQWKIIASAYFRTIFQQ